MQMNVISGDEIRTDPILSRRPRVAVLNPCIDEESDSASPAMMPAQGHATVAWTGEDEGMCRAAWCGSDDGLGLPFRPQSSSNEEPVDVLAQELTRISIKERETVYEEIHGVVNPMEESLDFLEEVYASLESELKKIKKKTAYDRALFLSPRYVNDPAFRLKFLRSTRFDAKRAAAKMAAFFESKLELFGEETLVKRITLEDLDKEDLANLNNGTYHFLPLRDRSNRAICLVMQNLANFKNWMSTIRCVWYEIMTEIENEDSQRNGFVNIFYNLGESDKLYSPGYMTFMSKAYLISEETLPYRNAAVHYCYYNRLIMPALRLMTGVAGKDTRLRFRTHCGSHVECMYALLAFGIPTNKLPFDNQGRFTNNYMDEFLRKRRQIEEEYRQSCVGRTDYPSRRDVLMGRGKPYQEYPGNLLLSDMIEGRKEEYQRVDRFQKICISIEIANMMKEQGSRFLARDKETDGWVEADESVVREKISSAFRTTSKRHNTNYLSSKMGLAPKSDENASPHSLSDDSYPQSIRKAAEGSQDTNEQRQKRQKFESERNAY